MKIAQVRKMIEKAGAKLTYSRVYGQYFAWVADADGRVVSSGKFFSRDELESMGTFDITPNVIAPLFPDFYCDEIATDYSEEAHDIVATASYKTGHVYSDGKAQRAIGYSIGGRFVMSLPARLNGGAIPSLEMCAEILGGLSVAEECRQFNMNRIDVLAERMNAECLDWLVYPSVSGNDEFILRADDDGIYVCWSDDGARVQRVADSWIGAPRVNLAKPDMPQTRAAVAPVSTETNAEVFERVRSNLAARRLAESDEENARAIAYENERANAARRLAGDSQ